MMVMAFEIEAMGIATEAFVRNVCDNLEMTDEQRHVIEDGAVDLPGELALCGGQSEVNELLTTRLGEVTSFDEAVAEAMAGSIDFFWQMYEDSSQSEMPVA